MAGFDLESIFQAASLVNNQQAQGAQQVAGLSNAGAGIANEVAENTVRAGVYQADVARTEAEYLLKTQNQRLAIANAFGTNQGAASDIITGFGNQARALAVELQGKEEAVLELEANNNLLSNPLGWLTDVLIGDDVRGERDLVKGKMDSLLQTSQNLNAATQQSVQTQNAIQQTVNQGSIDSMVNAKVAAASADAGAARLQAIQYQIQGVEALAGVGADAFQRNIQAYNLGMQAESLADSRENRKLRLAELQKEAVAAKQESEYYVGVTKRIVDAAALTGRTEVNLTPEEVQRTYKSGGPRAAYLQEMEQVGFGLEVQGGSATGVLGKDPVEAATRFAALGGQGNEQWKAGSLEVIQIAASAAQQNFAVGGVKPSPEQLSGAIKEQIAQQARRGSVNVSQAKDDYAAIPNLKVLTENKAKVFNPAGQKIVDTVVQDLLLSGNDNPEAELVLATAIKRVQDGTLSPQDFKDGMHNFYQGSVGLKASTGGYNAFMLPMPEKYGISVDRIVGDKSWASALYNITPMGIAEGIGGNLARGAFNIITDSDVPAPKVTFDLTNKADYDTIFTMLMSKDRAAKIRAGAAE